MSKVDFTVKAKSRSEKGKGASRRLRRLANTVPAIIYGGDTAPEMIMIEHNHLNKLLENEAFYSHILTVEVDGKKEQAVLKDMQRHPFKPRVLHLDFLRITGKEKITMHVPIHFVGEEKAPGVVDDQGVLTHMVSEIVVRCLPKDLPEFIEVDLSQLGLGDNMHLSEIKLPKGVESVELAHHHDLVVANVHIPRAVEEEEVAVEEGTVETPPSEVPVEPKGKEKNEEGGE